MTPAIRLATRDDVDAITRLVNDAFRVEDVFKSGDRTDAREVAEHLQSGEFLVIDAPGASPETRHRLAACVYVERNADDAYFGMLSIDPRQQGRGLGRLMIDSLEARCREAGCLAIEIHVINLREELPPFYRRFGYEVTGTLPSAEDGSAKKPYHFLVMRKPL